MMMIMMMMMMMIFTLFCFMLLTAAAGDMTQLMEYCQFRKRSQAYFKAVGGHSEYALWIIESCNFPLYKANAVDFLYLRTVVCIRNCTMQNRIIIRFVFDSHILPILHCRNISVNSKVISHMVVELQMFLSFF